MSSELYPTEDGMYPQEDVPAQPQEEVISLSGSEPSEDVEVAARAAPAAAAASSALIVKADKTDLHLGDYVGFELISPSKEWRLSLGKVVGFPTTRTVKVAHYDPVNDRAVTQDPESEQALHETAEREDKMDLWHDREALRDELSEATEAEKEAAARLFEARDGTLQKQSEAADRTAVALEQLDTARAGMQNIPPRQWRDVRTSYKPTGSVQGVLRAVMLILHQDRTTAWDEMQAVMREPNFLDHILDWDCTVTPMSLPRRRKIVDLCSGEGVEDDMDSFGGGGARRSSRGATGKRKSKQLRGTSPSGYTVAAIGANTGAMAQLDSACRAWINAQLVCSEAGEAQAMLVEECFTEQQEQRILLREVNDMRVNISRIETQMKEKKLAILAAEDADAAMALLPAESKPVDHLFYMRTYPDKEHRFVQEVILRDSIVVNFGPGAEEDHDGYVHLNTDQVNALRAALVEAGAQHDSEEVDALLERKQREEEEMAELDARVAELRGRSYLSPEEEEELQQLEAMRADAEHRHRATVRRLAELEVNDRAAPRQITTASKKQEFKYTRLHCKMSGDWEEILNDPERYDELVEALQNDLSSMLNVPTENILEVEARCGSLLLDFTVKHSGELDDDELQDLVNNGNFTALSNFYEKVTFKKTSPLNTPEQEASFSKMLSLEKTAEQTTFSGMGIQEKLEDYHNEDGSLTEEFGSDITNDEDYRKAIITVAPVRDDYDECAVLGPKDVTVEDMELPTEEVAPVAQEAVQSRAVAADVAEAQSASGEWDELDTPKPDHASEKASATPVESAATPVESNHSAEAVQNRAVGADMAEAQSASGEWDELDTPKPEQASEKASATPVESAATPVESAATPVESAATPVESVASAASSAAPSAEEQAPAPAQRAVSVPSPTDSSDSEL